MTTDDRDQKLSVLSGYYHSHCIVCGSANSRGLKLQFTVESDGSVVTEFPCGGTYQGYNGTIHGGIISCLLDGAMTNCLFCNGVTATTGELNIRYLHPVIIGMPAVVRARLQRSHQPLYIVEADLSQDDKQKVRAIGKFMEKPAR